MNSLYSSIAVVALGALGNLLWLLHNLRLRDQVRDMETRIGARIDELKKWMDEKYVSVDYLQLADERHQEVLRRLEAIESGKVISITRQAPTHCA